MKVDLNYEDIKAILNDEDIIVEEKLDKKDNKRKKNEIQNKNTRNIMRR